MEYGKTVDFCRGFEADEKKGIHYLVNHEFTGVKPIEINFNVKFLIHSFSILSDDRSKASCKTIPPQSAI